MKTGLYAWGGVILLMLITIVSLEMFSIHADENYSVKVAVKVGIPAYIGLLAIFSARFRAPIRQSHGLKILVLLVLADIIFWTTLLPVQLVSAAAGKDLPHKIIV